MGLNPVLSLFDSCFITSNLHHMGIDLLSGLIGSINVNQAISTLIRLFTVLSEDLLSGYRKKSQSILKRLKIKRKSPTKNRASHRGPQSLELSQPEKDTLRLPSCPFTLHLRIYLILKISGVNQFELSVIPYYLPRALEWVLAL